MSQAKNAVRAAIKHATSRQVGASVLYVAIAAWTLQPLALANEEDLLFIERLRGRGYHDTALLYLDQLQARPQLDATLKSRIPYERAITLLDAAKINRDSKTKTAQLDSALAYLNQFVKESPNAPEAATANLRRAEILLARTSAEVGSARTLQGAAATEANDRARKSASEAREILTTAENQYQTALKAFPTHIDKVADAEKFAARAETENRLISVQLDLARSSYEEAQTHPPDSAQRKELLQAAADAYEKLHQKYRTNVAGLVARMWQGKCFEEQGDLPKALGIYKEILDQPDNSPSMSALKDQARQFQLICLNRKSPPDYAAVTSQGEEWVKGNKSLLRSRVGLGIRLELAKAYEGLGDDRNLIKPEQLKFWRLAATHARDVSQFGEFSREGMEILRRLEKKISGDEKAPDAFEPALFVAQAKLQERQEKQKLFEEATAAKKPAAELAKMRQELSLLDQEAMRSFELALKLASRQDDPVKVNKARYLYGLCAYLTGKSFEAAVICEQAAIMARGDEDQQLALDAAYLSLMSLVQAYQESQSEGAIREAELEAVVNAANRMLKRFPDTEKANDVRMQMGNLYKLQKRFIDATGWYLQIPATGGKYAEAQMAAGQAFWNAYLAEATKPESMRVDAAQMTEWRQTAQKKLEQGVAKISENLPPEGTSPPELIAGKWSLAQILVGQGQDKEAVKLLTAEPHSPRKAIEVPDEKKRPATGIKNRAFAGETLKLLVRAYIGSGQTKEANQAMKDLEKVAAGQAGADVTQLYIGISKLLKEELDRFKETGETERYNQLRTAFEEFMGDLSKRTEGQTWASLSWIGETYAALGEASAGDQEKQDQFFGKSVEAFESILSRSENEPEFASANQLLSTKVRLIRAHRMKKNFEAGEKIINELLASRKNDVVLQTQAAELYLDWGTNSDAKYLNIALVGNPATGVWGFGALGQRLQQAMDSGRADLLPQYLDARYNAGTARLALAESQGDQKKRATQLKNAEIELVASLSVLPDLTAEQRGRFNDLYRKVLEASGKPAVDMPLSREVAMIATETTETPENNEPGVAGATGNPKAADKKPDEPEKIAEVAPPMSTTTAYAIIGGIVVACLGVVGFFIMSGNKQKKRSRKTPGRSEPTSLNVDFGGGAPAALGSFDFDIATKPTGKAPPKPASRPKPAGTATRTAGEKSTGEKATGEKTTGEKTARPAGTPKPRPKPPVEPPG